MPARGAHVAFPLQVLQTIMENLPFSTNVSTMRSKHGLPHREYRPIFQTFLHQNTPLVVPINEACFGGAPSDWPHNFLLTEFLLLRNGPVPKLADDLASFIAAAKAAGAPLLSIGFSSMPVPRALVLDIATRIATRCAARPRVVALVGGRARNAAAPEALEQQVRALAAEGRVFEAPGAPYAELFPAMDCVVVHGGLGSTAEALRAGVPCLVTGTLLLDQRFWGKRVRELGVGPAPVHITDFQRDCVALVDDCLRPGNAYGLAARRFAQGLAAPGAGPRGEGAGAAAAPGWSDGVRENVAAVLRLAAVGHCMSHAGSAPGVAEVDLETPKPCWQEPGPPADVPHPPSAASPATGSDGAAR